MNSRGAAQLVGKATIDCLDGFILAAAEARMCLLQVIMLTLSCYCTLYNSFIQLIW